MPERRLPLGLIVIAPVVIGFGVYAFASPTEVPDPRARATATAEARDATATPNTDLQTAIAAHPTSTPTAGLSSPTPAATATVAVRGDFREGAWVRVNAGAGDCLNARNQPSLDSDWVIVNTCLPHGFEGYLTGTPVEAEGHWWWFLAGAGWVAEEFLQFVEHADIRAHTVPALAGRGRIAFVRDQGELWVMDAGGGNQRLLVPGGKRIPLLLHWSPDGAWLAYTIVTGGMPEGAAVIIVNIDTGESRRFDAAFGAEWSPDGTRIGVVADPELGGVGGGAIGVPAIIDVATGARTVLSAERFYQQDPPAFNHDGTMLLMSYSPQSAGADDPRRPRIIVTDLAGRELHAIEMPENGFISRPRWSPVDNRIAFHESDGTTPRYRIYDLARGHIASTDVPRASEKIGGGCGAADMWLTAWSADGASLLYSFSMGDTGANGVWAWDIASGKQTVVPAINASAPSAGREGWFVFGSSGYATSYIFAGSTAGGFPAIITDGHSPAWSPVAR